MAPPRLAPRLHGLPPILHNEHQDPMPSSSKAPRGLSVLPRVAGILTGASISPRSSLRQRPGRWTIHARRNLPDKELRYLRTVIVTAGLHRGFSSELAPLPLTFRQWPGFTSYTSPFGLAESCVFTKQSPGLGHCDPPKRVPLLPKLRGHFAEFLNEVSLAHLRILSSPTCVGLRYGLFQAP